MELLKWSLLMESQAHKLTSIKKIKRKTQNLKIGDHVKMSKYKNIFAKGYT